MQYWQRRFCEWAQFSTQMCSVGICPIQGTSKVQVGIQVGMHLPKLQPLVATINLSVLGVLWSGIFLSLSLTSTPG